MNAVRATEKITTRCRPETRREQEPAPEQITSHAALCPVCERETRVKIGVEGHVFGSCQHFAGIVQRGEEISIEFNGTVR
jgi:hypothetical protein